MVIIFDIGNTRTKTGVFEGDKLLEFRQWQPSQFEDIALYLRSFSVQKVAWLASGAAEKRLLFFLKKNYSCTELTAATPLPFRNLYRTPHTLGRDRMAAVAGASVLFPNKNCLVIDAGTCVTYDFLDEKNNYHGGSIAPGIKMRLRAMHEQTAALPLVEPQELGGLLVGYDTETALRTGAQLGVSLEIEGFVAAYRAKFGQNIQVVLTGGDAELLASQIECETLFLEPYLVLKGLRAILVGNE